jgi:hypothetical protein
MIYKAKGGIRGELTLDQLRLEVLLLLSSLGDLSLGLHIRKHPVTQCLAMGTGHAADQLP